MKKSLIAILLVALIAPMIMFAAEAGYELDPAKDYKLEVLTKYDMPISTRAKGMGGAGIAFPSVADAFFMNPAGFAKRVGVYLPSAEVILYHPYDFLRPDSNGSSLIDKIEALQTLPESEKESATTDLALDALKLIETEKGKLFELNAGVGFDILGFTFGVHVHDSLHTIGASTSVNILDELNVTANIGYAHRIKLGDKLWFDLGANWRPTYKAYTTSIAATDFITKMMDSSTDPTKAMMTGYPVAAGYALPFDLGLNFSGSWFSVGVVGRNILGTYNMTRFDNLDSFVPNWSSVFGNKDFQIKTPWSIDVGFGFRWDNAFFKPTLVCDIVDINSMFTAEKFDAREFMNHVKAGAELRLLSFLDVRGGLNQGYWTIGAGLDLAIIKVDVAYYWSEFGDTLGDTPLDAVSVRINVGYDR